MSHWTFLTNHGAVLSLLYGQPDLRAREIAARIGITERAVLRIVSELEADGYIVRRKVGRVNQYSVNVDQPLRRPHQRDVAVGQLLDALNSDKSTTT